MSLTKRIIIPIALIALAMFAVACSSQDERPFGSITEFDDPVIVKDVLEDDVVAVSECDFSREVDLRTSERYGLFGDDVFDTVVCGYFDIQEEEVYGELNTVAYFKVMKFMDEGFKASIQQAIDEGNSLNRNIDGNLALSMGCLEEGGIIGVDHENGTDGAYIDFATQIPILASTADYPISLILSYGEHEGFGGACLNLMHSVELY